MVSCCGCPMCSPDTIQDVLTDQEWDEIVSYIKENPHLGPFFTDIKFRLFLPSRRDLRKRMEEFYVKNWHERKVR